MSCRELTHLELLSVSQAVLLIIELAVIVFEGRMIDVLTFKRLLLPQLVHLQLCAFHLAAWHPDLPTRVISLVERPLWS